MDNFKTFLLILWGLFFLFLLYEIFSIVKYRKWLNSLKQKPLDERLKKYIENLEEYKKLNTTQKQILEYKIQRFMHEKEFIGVNLNITDEIKTIVSFYACLVTTAYPDFCYPSLRYIYIYPYTVILDKTQKGFVMSNETTLISGEAVGEAVVLVWDEIKKEIHHKKGRNVVIHEFAHELDFEESEINGIPPIEKSKLYEWNKIMFGEYKKFKKKVSLNRFLNIYSLIDRYAATNPAEFFAVLSEYYFEKPEILKKHFPDIYKELKNFYKTELI